MNMDLGRWHQKAAAGTLLSFTSLCRAGGAGHRLAWVERQAGGRKKQLLGCSCRQVDKCTPGSNKHKQAAEAAAAAAGSSPKAACLYAVLDPPVHFCHVGEHICAGGAEGQLFNGTAGTLVTARAYCCRM
ncbi:hypothetical protein ABPG75_001671 [Micractinium tetrahymenae]